MEPQRALISGQCFLNKFEAAQVQLQKLTKIFPWSEMHFSRRQQSISESCLTVLTERTFSFAGEMLLTYV